MTRKTWIKSLAVGLGVTVTGAAFAQSGTPTPVSGTPYVRFTENLDDLGGYVPLSNANSEFNIPAGSLFSQRADIPIPFPFRFYNDTVSTVSVGVHGGIAMQPGVTLSTSNWAPNGAPDFGTDIDGFIAPFWGTVYLNGRASSAFRWQVRGRAPTRQLALEYINLADNSSSISCCNRVADIQVRLFEGLSGRIEIDYRIDAVMTGSGFNATATSGMESLQGTGGVSFMTPDKNPNFEWTDLVSQLNGRRLIFVQDPGVELVALAVTPPDFAPLGANYQVEATIANLNANTLGPFDVELQVSDDPSFPPDETFTVGATTLVLPQYQTRSIRITANSSLTPEGAANVVENRYYHRVVVDTGATTNPIPEINEGNNTATSDSLTRYLPSLPDITVDRVRINRSEASPGAPITVEITASNVGSEVITDAEVAVMLSGNPAISPQDSELGSVLFTLDRGETETRSVQVNLPTQINSGEYFLGAYADIANELDEGNEANNGRAALVPILISGGNVDIITSRLPSPRVGATYTAQLTAIGGNGSYSWALPAAPNRRIPGLANLELETGQGLIFGICQQPGRSTFQVRATSGTQSDTSELTLECVDPDEPLTVVTRDVPDGIIGQEYEFALLVTGGESQGGAGATWSATGLPPGIELTASGILAGSPTEAGEYAVTVIADDGTTTDDQGLTIRVRDNQNLLIQVSELPDAILGQSYSQQILASGGIGDIFFSTDPATLPDGMFLRQNGVLTGVPQELGPNGGLFEFEVRAQDNPANGLRASDRNTFRLRVMDQDEGETRFQIRTTQLPPWVVNQARSSAVSATGGVPDLSWSVEGVLPDGLSWEQIGNEIQVFGEPTAIEERFVVITVTDRIGRTASRVLTVSVVAEGDDVPQCPDRSDERCDGFDTNPDDSGCSNVGGSSGPLFLLMLGLALGGLRRRATQPVR
ncbi:MAG: hypothetical protein HC923_06900 [Myxococcales bacterium]|nr:hypothetical protein [Myxococcales bacterium]